LRALIPKEPNPHVNPAYQDKFIEWLITRSANPAARPGKPEPASEASDHADSPLSSMARLEIVAARWGRAIVKEGYLPQDYAVELRDILRELALLVRSPELARISAEQIGLDLALKIRITTQAFRATIELLTEFLSSLTLGERYRTTRWVSVLAKVGQGYAEGTRARALDGQKDVVEALHRAKNRALHASLVSAKRFQQFFDNAPVAMGVMDFAGRIVSANTSLCRLLGLADDQILGKELANVAHYEEDRSTIRSLYPTMSAGHSISRWWDFRLATSGQEPTWVRLQWGQYPSKGEVPIVLEDVTEHRTIRRWLHHYVEHDEPSDMHTRRRFIERLDDLLSHPTTAGLVGLYAIRLDGVDTITAQLGPATAARVTRILATRVRSAAEHADMVSQLDADTIAILVTSPDSWAEVGTAMKHLARWLAAPVKATDEHAVSLTPIIGAVKAKPDHIDTDALIRRLYDGLRGYASAASRRRGTVTDTTACAREHHLNSALAALPQVLEVDDVRLEHTPIGSARSGHVVGSRVALQWTYPADWHIPLHEVLELADELGLSAPIGRWTIDRAAQQLEQWYEKFGERCPFLRVDLPKRQPLNSTLASHVTDTMDTHQFPAHLLQLGVEESSMLDRNGDPRRELISITGTGVRLVLNGFGDRVRRMRLLTELPLRGVVIAPQLTAELADKPAATGTKPMIQTLIELATALKMDVTIPSVDTREQREKVRKMGGTHVHGDVTGRPGPASTVEELLHVVPQEIRAV
jgi:PAS domain S-box-containing protein